MNNNTRELTLEQKYKEAVDGLASIMECALRSEEIDWRTFYRSARDTLRQIEPELAARIDDAPYHEDYVIMERRRLEQMAEADQRKAHQDEVRRKSEERFAKEEAEREARFAENKLKYGGKSVRFISYPDYVAWHKATLRGHRKAYIESRQLPDEVLKVDYVTYDSVRCSVRGRACSIPVRLIEVV